MERMESLTVSFIGGTGPQGRGLALRLAQAGYPIVVGSRDPGRAEAAVEALRQRGGLSLRAAGNREAAERADVVFLTVPWAAHCPIVKELAPVLAARVLVDVVNPLAFDESGPRSLDVPEGSAAEQAQQLVPGAQVVSGFHDVSARRLLNDSGPVDTDVLLCGDHGAAKDIVLELARKIPGMRGIDAGPLRLSRHLEAMTAVLLSINRRYRTQAGIRITGM
jgi:8-hydroxy-5-deazaflavin:NADPH oxidoreductase